MRVGVGLPAGIPQAPAALVLEWARLADVGPFSSVAVVDRLAYDSFEPLTALAVVAGATRRVRLATTIVIAPIRNTALLAKEAASLDALSGGRLVLGVAVGARHQDYDAAGADYRTRGQRLAEQLAELRERWEDEHNRPWTGRPGGPELLVGGLSDATFARVARYADGYVHGGGPPRAFARVADKVRAAWRDAGRPGDPIIWGQGYFVLGDDDTVAAGAAYMRDYYSFTGPFAERIAAGMLTTPQQVVQFIRGYAEAGCDELAIFPAVAHINQLQRLAEVLVRVGIPAQAW